jgi:hypothetical protein
VPQDPITLKLAKVAASAAFAKGKRLLQRHDPDKLLAKAAAENVQRTSRIVAEILVEVAISGQKLGGDQALQWLLTSSSDRVMIRRRVRALMNEAGVSTDERIAMLAVGHFVRVESTSMRERLDWAVRGLFPDDADALGVVIEESGRLFPSRLIAFDSTIDETSWSLDTRDTHGPELETARKCSAQSLRALASAHCISIADVGGVPSTAPHPNCHIRLVRHRIEVLPLGRELHKVLGKIGWREIARRAHMGREP